MGRRIYKGAGMTEFIVMTAAGLLILCLYSVVACDHKQDVITKEAVDRPENITGRY